MPVDCRVRLWHPRNDKKKTALGSRIILYQAWTSLIPKVKVGSYQEIWDYSLRLPGKTALHKERIRLMVKTAI